MITPDTLTEQMLLGGLSKGDLAQAEACMSLIHSPVRQGLGLFALFDGDPPARTQVEFHDESIFGRCSCGLPGPCPHVFALLLQWVRHPASFAVQPVAERDASLPVTPVDHPPAQRPSALPGWLASPFAQRQQRYVEQLARELERSRLQDLRAAARLRGWRVKSTDKLGVARQVAQAMAAPASNLGIALGLDEEVQRVLAALIVAGDGARREAVARISEALGFRSAGTHLTSAMVRLRELSLILPPAAGPYGPLSDCCPDVMARQMLPVAHKAIIGALGSTLLEGEPAGAPAAGEVVLADGRSFVRVVGQIALLLHQASVPLRPPMPRPMLEGRYPGLRGWDYDPQEVLELHRHRTQRRDDDLVLTVPPPAPALPDDAIARLAPVAGNADRLEFLFALLVASGIVEPGSPVTIWPEVEQEYLSRNEAAQRAILARTYFDMTNWSEVWGLWPGQQPALQIKRHIMYRLSDEDKLLEDLAFCRLAMVRALACLPDGRWIRLQELYPLLRSVWPRFDEPVREGAAYYGANFGWFLAKPGSTARFTTKTAEEWDLAQGRFVRRMLAGPLHWLGLADLRFEHGQLVAFRLHGLADLFWDVAEAPPLPSAAEEAPGAESVSVDGNHIRLRPSAVSPQALGLVARFARLTQANVDRFEYELDARAAYHSYGAGATLAEIIAGWEQLLPVPMPDGIREQLTRWWSAFGQVHIYQGLTVIEFADDYGLAEMKAATSLAQHVVAEVSPRLVIIDGKGVPTLVAELEKAGYTPKQTDQV